MNESNIVVICIAAIVFALILVPPFILLFRMGKNRKPYRALPPNLTPLSEPCELCHKKGQPGLTDRFVLTESRSNYIVPLFMRSFTITRTKEIARIRVSLCAECYLRNASTFSNKLKGNNPLAIIEHWHNRNNPIFMETMFQRIAFERMRREGLQRLGRTKAQAIIEKLADWSGLFSSYYPREEEWLDMLAQHPDSHEYDKFFDDK